MTTYRIEAIKGKAVKVEIMATPVGSKDEVILKRAIADLKKAVQEVEKELTNHLAKQVGL